MLVLYGLKSGWNLPLYPYHIIILEKNIYIKIFKLIGSICTFIHITGIVKQLDFTIYLITIIISMFYLIYRLFLVFYAIKQWVINVKTGKLLVRKSDLD